MIVRPESEREFVEAIAGQNPIWHATDSLWDVITPTEGIILDYSGWTGFSFYSPEDLVVTARSGTTIAQLQSFLRQSNQCLPLGECPWGGDDPTLAHAIGFGLPHVAESTSRSWREWILGMTVLLSDGTVAKSGSKVVKSVAGYDAHKLFIGSRGSFGVILDVTLRAHPGKGWQGAKGFFDGLERPWIQRVRRTDFHQALEAAGDKVMRADPGTGTLWARSNERLTRFSSDWVLRGSPGDMEWAPDEIPFIQRAKSLLDPIGRLNPGALGIC